LENKGNLIDSEEDWCNIILTLYKMEKYVMKFIIKINFNDFLSFELWKKKVNCASFFASLSQNLVSFERLSCDMSL